MIDQAKVRAVLAELAQFEEGAQFKRKQMQDRADFYGGKATAYATARSTIRRDLLSDQAEDVEESDHSDPLLISLGVIVNTLHAHGRPMKLTALTKRLGVEFCAGLDLPGLLMTGIGGGVIQNPRCNVYSACELWRGLPQARGA